jgi:DNA repair exonuclease SbcCD nuclease subunit
VLKVLVTSDWRIDRSFARFGRDTKRLTAARLEAVERLFAEAETQGVRAVVVAGDVFETPTPSSTTREAMLSVLRKLEWKNRTLLFVPGDRDALVDGSVWSDAAFLDALPAFARVASAENFELELSADALLVAQPCFSRVRGPLSFAPRAEGDARARLNVTHVLHAVPERADADVLALGGRAHFHFADSARRVVFSGTHEPFDFGEQQGQAALISLNPQTRQAVIEPRAVNALTWETVKLGSLEALRRLAQREDLHTRVLRAEVDAALSLADFETFERELDALDAPDNDDVFLETDRTKLTLAPSQTSAVIAGWPDVLQRTAKELLTESENPQRHAVALRALTHLARLTTPERG